ncbi:MAG: YdbL family protein [Opitutales bacterium]|nr:YdbL family protein [Opitutales bacterium]
MKSHCLLSFLALLTLFVGAVSVYADNAQDRMRDRIPALDALRMAGKVGENNLGFLSARVDLSPEAAALLVAENNDRRAVYARLARASGETVEAVGRQRALRIARQARPGVWLQNAEGEWYQRQP